MVGSIEVTCGGGIDLPFRVGQLREEVSCKSVEFENLKIDYNMLLFEKNMIEEDNRELQSKNFKMVEEIKVLTAQRDHFELICRKNQAKLAAQYQTKTCKFWAMNMPCPHKGRCTYAQAHMDPAPSPNRCFYFVRGQICPKGATCRYRHQ